MEAIHWSNAVSTQEFRSSSDSCALRGKSHRLHNNQNALRVVYNHEEHMRISISNFPDQKHHIQPSDTKQ